MKYILNTAKTQMYINKSTIYFNNGKQFFEKTLLKLVLPRSLGKIEKSFSPKLTDYFIQGVRNDSIMTRTRKYCFKSSFISHPNTTRNQYLFDIIQQ